LEERKDDRALLDIWLGIATDWKRLNVHGLFEAWLRKYDNKLEVCGDTLDELVKYNDDHRAGDVNALFIKLSNLKNIAGITAQHIK
jgi:hypothetical protein